MATLAGIWPRSTLFYSLGILNTDRGKATVPAWLKLQGIVFAQDQGRGEPNCC